MQDDLRAAFKAMHADLGTTKSALESLLTLKAELGGGFLQSVLDSKSQLGQDFFVLAGTDFKSEGFFVEFGATDGRDLSNTWLLEKRFQWKGIVSEPARTWHASLHANRTCHIETACVWKESGSVVIFNETDSRELSTIAEFSSNDRHGPARASGRRYRVPTISLLDLLAKYEAPKVIDYLSIDTEGSELDILRAFDFDRHSFRIITCEHNYTPSREGIRELLTSHGYVRIFEDLSKWDDWYVHPSL
jgi:FkbM family methyltransferase